MDTNSLADLAEALRKLEAARVAMRQTPELREFAARIDRLAADVARIERVAKVAAPEPVLR